MTASLTFRAFAPWLLGLLVVGGLGGCALTQGGVTRDTFRPYVAEVVQGNFVSKEQRQALRPGMSRAQVRDILGTPLVASVFHADRWDYAFSIRRQGVEPQNFRVTLLFKGDALDQIAGDDLPSESEFVSRLVKPQVVRNLPALEASEEILQKYPARKQVEANERPVPPLPASYPPLEPVAR